MELAREVRVQILAPLLLREALGAVDGVDDAGVRDDRVTAAEFLDELGDRRLCRAAVAHVEVRARAHRRAVGECPLDRRIDVARRDLAIAGGERAVDRSADAASRPGYQPPAAARRAPSGH